VVGRWCPFLSSLIVFSACKRPPQLHPSRSHAPTAATADAATQPPDAGLVHCPRSSSGALCLYFEPDGRDDPPDAGIRPGVTVSFLCADGECRVLIDDREVTTESHLQDVDRFVSILHVTDNGERLFLLDTYPSDGCPAAYRLLHVRRDASFTLTDYFGNCDAPEAPDISAKQLRFTFPAWPRGKLKRMQYVYDIGAHTLKELPAGGRR
jgi:hypothetical protein